MTTTEPQKLDKEGYILLPKTWTESGWLFKFIKKLDENWSLYLREKTTGEGRQHWELVKITKQEEFNFKGNIIPKKWKYPGTAAFGKMGYDCISEQRALEIYESIKHKEEEKEEEKSIKIIFPSRKEFTIKEIEQLNSDKTYAQIYNKIKDLLTEKKIKVTGEKENTNGKPSKIYKVI